MRSHCAYPCECVPPSSLREALYTGWRTFFNHGPLIGLPVADAFAPDDLATRFYGDDCVAPLLCMQQSADFNDRFWPRAAESSTVPARPAPFAGDDYTLRAAAFPNPVIATR